MDLDLKLALLLVLAIFGIYIVGNGITGMTVSESCCFGDDCPPENQCVSPQIEHPALADNFYLTIAGVFIFLIACAVGYGELVRHGRI